MEKAKKHIKIVLEDFQHFIKKPECFLETNDSLKNQIKTALKQTYDMTKSNELLINKCGALPELIIKHFETEQIWQQIELQNEAMVSNSLTNVSKLISGKDHLLFYNLEDEIIIENNTNGIEREEIIKNIRNEHDKNISESNGSGSEMEINEQDLSDKYSEGVAKKQTFYHKTSVVDDEFFNLNEMENFLNTEEKKIQDEDLGNDSDKSLSAEGSIDLFGGNSDDEDKMRTAKFKDFFVAKDNAKNSKQRNILDADSSDAEIENDNVKSSLELRQERLQKKINLIEQNNVSEKPWQLKGEITADNRPQNSLLEEIVEFDLTSRPAPIITEQTTLQLDDIIKQRIKNRAFDSVLRKAKPIETLVEYKKKLVLDQEKNKQSLAQIYEQEFIDKQTSLEPENKDKDKTEPELHREIKNLMKNLFNKLDSLSNFHFTPKPAIPELRVVNNLPAISLEEVAPIATSDVALLAPEEVKNKTGGEIIGKTERTSTDKNRERRKKKQKQRMHLKEKQKREKVIGKLNPGLGNKYIKEKFKKQWQQVTKDKNIEKMTGSTTYTNIKSSKAFFTQLQEEVQTRISNKVNNKGTKKRGQHLEAKRIKL